jgi:hypothetical protein
LSNSLHKLIAPVWKLEELLKLTGGSKVVYQTFEVVDHEMDLRLYVGGNEFRGQPLKSFGARLFEKKKKKIEVDW